MEKEIVPCTYFLFLLLTAFGELNTILSGIVYRGESRKEDYLRCFDFIVVTLLPVNAFTLWYISCFMYVTVMLFKGEFISGMYPGGYELFKKHL